MTTANRHQFTSLLAGFAGLALGFPAIARAASSSSDAELEKALLAAVPVLGERSMGNVNAPRCDD